MDIKDSAGKATEYAREKVSSAKSAATEAVATARDQASVLASNARETAAQARLRTADGVDANPMAALIGGLALGALAAAVLPRTRKEDELLGSLGGKINDTARNAAQAAKDVGQTKLDELGINKDSAMDKAREMAQSAAGIVKESANAAASSVKGS